MEKSLEERIAYLEKKVSQLEKQLQNKPISTPLQNEQGTVAEQDLPGRKQQPSKKAIQHDAMTTMAEQDDRDLAETSTETIRAGVIQKEIPNQSTTKQYAKKPGIDARSKMKEDNTSPPPAAGGVADHSQAKMYSSKKSERINEPIEWDVFIFQKLLPRVFIFILILGVLWGLKASYDYGFITIQIILTLCIALSIVMAILGVFQINKERRVLGQVLIGGAIPIFILTIFAMHQMYDMIGPTTAMVFNIVAIIAGIIFSYTLRSESIGVIGVIAGILVPYLIETSQPNYFVFVSYEAALYLLFLSLALYMNFRVLYFVATFFLHIAILALHLATFVPAQFALLTIMPIVFQQIALFAGLLLTKIKLKTQAHTLLVSLLLTSLWLGVVVEKSEATTVLIGLAIMYAISFYFFKKDTARAPIFMMNAMLATLFIFVVQDLDITYEVLLITTLIHLFYGGHFSSLLHYVIAGIQYIIAFFLFSIFYLESWVSYEMLHQLAFLVATVVGIYHINQRVTSAIMKQIGLPYVALLLMFFSSNISYLIAIQYNSFDSMPLILSSFWVIIAIGYMIFSKLTTITIGKYVGVAILFFTVAKVVLFDISFMSMTFRAILFIGLGLIGLIISRLYNKEQRKQK